MTLTGASYPRSYKGGRLPRSHAPSLGKVDLVAAIEQTSNPYFSLLASDVLDEPEELNRTARLFGYGASTGIDLPGEAQGNLPSDLRTNRTGLYATAIGQHTLLCTPLQTAVMLSTLANGGKVLQPTLVAEIGGAMPKEQPWYSFASVNHFAEKELRRLGINFPLFTVLCERQESHVADHKNVQIMRDLHIPSPVLKFLFEGMNRTVWGSKGTARPGAIKALRQNNTLLAEYLSLHHQMIGKTSTAEILFNPNVNPSSKPSLYKHIWFGSIGFSADAPQFEDPEIVVVVYLRYGDGGKEAAPLASQMIAKWREIKKNHTKLRPQ